MDRYRIMIVDDESDKREGIVSQIDWDALGYEVVAQAEHGNDALEKIEGRELDVVLTDIMMPFMDGLEMCSRLLKNYPALKIIIITGFNEFSYAKEAIRLNAVEYVLKPVNVEELTGILRKVHASIDENVAQKRDIEALQRSYDETLPLQRERFLSELLWGIVPEDDIPAQLASYELGIRDKTSYAVAVFEVRHSKRESPLVEWPLVPMSMRQIIFEQLDGKCAFEIVTGSAFIIAITAWDRENPIEDLLRVANEVCSECARVLELEVTAGVGRSRSAVDQIHGAFIEAKSALEYKAVVGGGSAIYIQDMEQERSDWPSFDKNSEQMLLSAIRFGSPEQLERIIDDILGRASECGEIEQQGYLLSVVNALYGIIQAHDLQNDPSVTEKLRGLMSLPAGWSAGAEMRGVLYELCQSISRRISARRATAARKLAEAAKQFIDEHYQDADLSVDRLCDFLHVSQSYFSTVFRQETGSSYVQYLTEVRMTHAVRLLQETDDKTYIIARKVGYEDPNYFSHVFKKRFGTSPVKYRSGSN